MSKAHSHSPREALSKGSSYSEKKEKKTRHTVILLSYGLRFSVLTLNRFKARRAAAPAPNNPGDSRDKKQPQNLTPSYPSHFQ